MRDKNQVFFIHGGMTFKNKSDYLNFLRTREVSTEKKAYWSHEYLQNKLGDNFEVINPRMPLQDNAKYLDWKITFESYIPKFRKNIILIGSSLGGIFLAKYLSENKFPKKILSFYLICPPYDNTLPGEDLTGGFKLKSDLSLIEKNCNNIKLLFSEDDNVVPLSHAQKYASKLKKAKLIIFNNVNGHFKISKFPEIVKLLKDDIKKL